MGETRFPYQNSPQLIEEYGDGVRRVKNVRK